MFRRLLASTFAVIANAALLDITQHLALVRATELRTVTAIPLRDVDDRWFAAWRLRLCLRWVSMPPAERKSPVAALTTDDRLQRVLVVRPVGESGGCSHVVVVADGYCFDNEEPPRRRPPPA